mgnify:FL=1
MKKPSVLRSALRIYIKIQGPLLAKGLAFSFLLGLVPLLFFLISLQALFGSTDTVAFVQNSLFSFLPTELRETIVQQILNTAGAGVGIVTIAAFLFTSVALFDGLEMALTTVLKSERRKFHTGRLISVAFLGLILILFYAISMLGGLVTSTVDAAGGNAVVMAILSRVVATVLSAVVVHLVYRVFARRRLRRGATFLVALITSVLWQGVLVAGESLAGAAAGNLLIYGALAFAVILLLYMRLLAELVIIGGIVVGILSPPEDVHLASLLAEGEQ